MEEVVYYNELYDLYGELLTDKQREYFEDYYFRNLSYSEIGDSNGVSRNAAFKQVHIVTKKLDEYEEKLQLKKKRDSILKIINNCNDDIKRKIETII